MCLSARRRPEVVAHPAVRARFQRMIDALYDKSTGSSSRIVRALLLPDPPSIDLGEVTDKGSIHQRAVLTARAGSVEALYASEAGEDRRVILARPTRLR